MSTIEELREKLGQLVADTAEEVEALGAARQNLSDKQNEINEEISSSESGRYVNESFSSALTAIEEAIEKLNTAAQTAEDYSQTLIDS